eukprot:TRINITY_DN930_c0_g1_i1.p1 TRINITY_DN930_c0_g1~~TRINITY_DN930_c0_g1_i1.p1  ORF type:complete len:128 (-),score=25.55 TRINITY_DN930_c0_g1_i1:345-728(-)
MTFPNQISNNDKPPITIAPEVDQTIPDDNLILQAGFENLEEMKNWVLNHSGYPYVLSLVMRCRQMAVDTDQVFIDEPTFEFNMDPIYSDMNVDRENYELKAKLKALEDMYKQELSKLRILYISFIDR